MLLLKLPPNALLLLLRHQLLHEILGQDTAASPGSARGTGQPASHPLEVVERLRDGEVEEGDDEGEADEEDDATVDDDDEETDEETEDEEPQARPIGMRFDSALDMRLGGLYASPSLHPL